MNRHRFTEHVGEVEIELEAESEAGLFEAALAAFVEITGADGSGDPVARELELAAADDALLLADWLSELVYLAEVESFVPERIVSLELGAGRLQATLAGHRDGRRHVVKAVTLHGLSLEQKGGAWHGHVVLDV